MFKKAAAIILCAAMAIPTVNAFAAQPVTQTVVSECAASAKTWDGKTALKAGKSYTVSDKVTVSSAVTVPKGTTLTVAKGGRLTVSSKGKLTVKGTLKVKSGAEMIVNGRLTLASGKKLTVDGGLKLGKNGRLTLNGKVTIGAFGIITGEPKKVSAGEKASIKANGVLDSAKLAKAFKTTSDTEQLLNAMGAAAEAIFVNGKVSALIRTMFPEGAYEQLEKEFDAERMGWTMDEALDSICAMMAAMIVDYYGSKPKSVDTGSLNVTYLPEKELPALYEEIAQYYNGITAAASISGDIKLQLENDSADISVNGIFVKIDGEWYWYFNENSLY